MKVADLDGGLLAEWVARANGWKITRDGETSLVCWDESRIPHSFDGFGYRPDFVWGDGGPIIEREKFELVPDGGGGWSARSRLIPVGDLHMAPCYRMYGDTLLIAAMRAYVASKFGETVLDEAL